jgi:uncharacterized protein YqeY
LIDEMADTLRQRLEVDLKTAMRGGDSVGRDTLRFLLAALKNEEIDKRGPLDAGEEMSLLQRQAKRQKESIEQFSAGGRTDLVEREEAQLEILKRYLPAELSETEVEELAQQVVAEVGATSMKDMSRVMPVLTERAGGRADGKRLSMAVKKVLNPA